MTEVASSTISTTLVLTKQYRRLNGITMGLCVVGIGGVVFSLVLIIGGQSLFPNWIKVPDANLIWGGGFCGVSFVPILLSAFSIRCAAKVRRYRDFLEASKDFLKLVEKEDLNCWIRLNELCQAYDYLFHNDVDKMASKIDDWFYFPNFASCSAEDAGFDELLTTRYKNITDKKDRSILAQQYKIHLMPQPEYAYATLVTLIEKLDSDAELRKIVTQVKIAVSAKSKPENYGNSQIQTPVIVIYLKKNKHLAEKALHSLFSHFKPFLNWGSGICPRFNQKGENPLIYYSQGDSFEKAKLSPALKAQVFEEDLIHFKPLDKHRLNVPEGF